MSRPQTAQQALDALLSGNANFVAGAPAHPRQDADLRRSLAESQRPFAALFGCADSRLSAEMIFDVGLGDLFVVRNAGQIIANTIIGSLEFAVGALGVPLILVLGHDSCGATKAAIDAHNDDLPVVSEYVQHLVDRLAPTVARSYEKGISDHDDITKAHVGDTIADLLATSAFLSDRISDGTLAVVGAHYKLAEGKVEIISTHGNIH
jgi:carbonic anhydrase